MNSLETLDQLHDDHRPAVGVRPSRSRPLRVLILERSRLAAEALMFVLDTDPRLEPIGYGLNSWQALELIASYDPDSVIVGADLVGLEQREFCSSVHQLFPDVRLIALQERFAPDEDEAGDAAPTADCFLTSCSSDELLDAILATDARLPFEPYPRPVNDRSARMSVTCGATDA
jgi:DNA-binding NarL/FixJ family response regulator